MDPTQTRRSDDPADGGLGRLDELRADRASQGISAEQQAELERLELVAGEDDSTDRAAAVLDTALSRQAAAASAPAAMPAALRARLLASGQAWASQRRADLSAAAQARAAGWDTARDEADGEDSTSRVHERAVVGRVNRGAAGRGGEVGHRRVAGWTSVRVWGGWAAAACLLMALALRPGMPSGGGGEGFFPARAGGDRATANGGAQAASIVTPWRQLMELRDIPDETLEFATLWRLETFSAQVSLGRVHWFPGKGKGFLQVAGLPALDSDEQYQLWVRDGGRDSTYMVNVGVFELAPEGGEQLIPISPALKVFRADTFMISIERRGGNPQPSGRFVAIGRVEREESGAGGTAGPMAGEAEPRPAR